MTKKQRVLRPLLAGLVALTALRALALDAGDPAPAFTVTRLDGEPVRLEDHLGERPVYLKFWATWCKYCVSEMPHLQEIQDRYGDEILVLAVNVGINESVRGVERFYRERGLELPTVFDAEGALSSSYKIIGTPSHVLIGLDGRIDYRSSLATDELDRRLAVAAKSVQANNLLTNNLLTNNVLTNKEDRP